MTFNKCMSEVRYSEFAKSMYGRTLRNRIPFDGMLEITDRCNHRCVHCCCNQDIDDQSLREKELSTSDIFKILDDIERRGCLWLLLTGGEPLIRNDFPDIYIYAKKKGFIVSLFTNGTLITSKVIDLFKEWPPHKVEVTLYGASKAVYEDITRTPGSFDRCMAGIEHLLKASIKLKLKTIAITLNKDEIWDMKAIAKNLGVDFRFDYVLQSRIDGSKGPRRYRISPEDAVRLDTMDEERRKSWVEYTERAAGFQISDLQFSCGGGGTSFFIDPYGRMSICDMCRAYSRDIKKEGFDRIWDVHFPEILKRRHPSDYKCIDCDAGIFCDHCAGWAMTEEGDPESMVSYICEIGRARKKILGSVKKKRRCSDEKEVFETDDKEGEACDG